MKPQSHIIQKVNWQITLTSERDERRICDQVKDEFYRLLNRELSSSWDTQAHPSEHVVIDKLEIDLGNFNKKELRKSISGQLRKHLNELVQLETLRSWQVHTNDQRSKQTKHRSAVDAFDHFLECGSLPWWYTPAKNGLITDIIVYRSNGNINLDGQWNELKWSTQKIKRLTQQFTSHELMKILIAVYNFPVTLIQTIQWEIERVTPFKKLQNKLVGLIITGFLIGEKNVITKFNNSKREALPLKKIANDFHPEIKKRIVKIFKNKASGHSWTKALDNKTKPQQIKKEKNLSRKSTEANFLTESEQAYFNEEIKGILSFGMDEDQEIISTDPMYVDGAGAVLLWPYLNELFKELKWVKEGNFTSKEKQRKAIALVHFIITGKTNEPEYEMAISKLLCGWKLKKPLKRKEKLKKQHKKLAIQLLQAVIKNWSVLKSTTTKGIQQSFLQRKGKLEKQGVDWKLTVKKQSYDVLLAQIPWSYSIIKLPWNSYLIKVDW